MGKIQEAKIILKHLDEYINVDYNFEEFYITAIIKGLTEIEELEKENEKRK